MDIKKWFPEDDPITQGQLDRLVEILKGRLSDDVLEGFLIVCSRFVTNFGVDRSSELERIFKTTLEHGKEVLAASLINVNEWVGGMDAYINDYPVSIFPPNPAFPQFRIVGIQRLVEKLYRMVGSASRVHNSHELVRDFIERTGRLPEVPRIATPVTRSKPPLHWCAYDAWRSPEATQNALQIKPEWSDCRLRATILTKHVIDSVYVAFTWGSENPADEGMYFAGYFYEPIAQDHPPLDGGEVQVGVDGSPPVHMLEEWDDKSKNWNVIWPV